MLKTVLHDIFFWNIINIFIVTLGQFKKKKHIQKLNLTDPKLLNFNAYNNNIIVIYTVII